MILLLVLGLLVLVVAPAVVVHLLFGGVFALLPLALGVLALVLIYRHLASKP